MKKIILLIMAINFYAFAAYIDFGAGSGNGAVLSDNFDVTDECGSNCTNGAIEYGVRIGGHLGQKFVLAGEFDGLANVYVDGDDYMMFNSFFVGPSLIFYPGEHWQLSGSLGYAWTANRVDFDEVSLPDGNGLGMALSFGYEIGKDKGALVGAKLFATTVGVGDGETMSNGGAMLFVRFYSK